jgi:transcriptional regulator GlxA family with amidase domain
VKRSVVIVGYEGVQALDLVGPFEVFTGATLYLLGQGRQDDGYDVTITSIDGRPVTTGTGLELVAKPLPDPWHPIDTVVLPGGIGIDAVRENPDAVDWVRTAATTARRVVSVCTGAFLAAQAGLLDGCAATTHWAYAGQLAREFPDVDVDPDPIFVRSSESVWTAAGVTAGIDLALALVERDLGRGIALAVARHLVVFLKRPGGQAQFSAALILQASADRFAELHAWIEANLADDLSLPRLAGQAGMSERTFGRRYREATGTTPAQAVERLRVELARQLLLDTQLPLKRIAARCGFGTNETMRRAFLRVQGVSPQDYRERFDRIGPA